MAANLHVVVGCFVGPCSYEVRYPAEVCYPVVVVFEVASQLPDYADSTSTQGTDTMNAEELLEMIVVWD